MARFNADAAVEANEIEIGGNVYAVPSISSKVLRKLTQFQEDNKGNDNDPDGPAKLLGLLLNVDWKVFEDTDVRVIKAAIEYISPSVTEEQKKTSITQ